MAALDLDHLSQGRFVLGLGTGPMHWTKGYYGMPYDKPVSRLREVVQILRHVEDGARTGTMKPWQGDCYQLEFHGYEPTAPPYREHLPVWIAALRPRMCELAGEVADGLIGHPVWSVEWSLGQAQQSLATANDQYISSLYEHNIAKVLLARAIGNAEQLAKQYLADTGNTTTSPNVNQNPAMPSPTTTPAPVPNPQAPETPRP